LKSIIIGDRQKDFNKKRDTSHPVTHSRSRKTKKYVEMDNCGKSGGIQTAGEKMMMERRHSGGYPTLSPQNPRGRRDVGKRCELAPREGRLVGGGSRRPMAPRRGGGLV